MRDTDPAPLADSTDEPGAEPTGDALPPEEPSAEAVDAFIARWREAQGAEISNAQSFVKELCRLLGLPQPDPRTGEPARDAYVFERPVVFQDGAESAGGRIDLYRRGCFGLDRRSLNHVVHSTIY